jgi:IS30 family transposase
MGRNDNTTKGKTFKQLSEPERYQIEGYLKAKLSVKEIAELLGRNRRIIEREIARGKVTLRDTNWKKLYRILSLPFI